MTTTAQRLLPRTPALNRWAFAAFVVVQCAVAVGVLLLGEDAWRYALIGLGVVVALVWLAFLPVHPWLAVPLLIGSTSLDMSGRLVQKTAIGIPITGFHIAFLIMVIAVAANSFVRRRVTFPTFELGVPFALFLGLIAISLTWSPNQPEATIDFVRMVMLVLFLYLTQVVLDSRAAITCTIVTMAVCVTGASVLGIVQMLTEEFFLPASFVLAAGANTPRATGTFHNPNNLGTFLMVGSLLLLGLLVNYRMSRTRQVLLLLAIGVGLAGLLSTFSRSNWVALLAGGLFLLSLSGKLKVRYLLGGLVVIALTLVALQSVLPIAEYIVTRVESIFSLFYEFGSKAHVSGAARVHFVRAGLGMWLDHPLLGAGWRAFPVILDAYKPKGFPHWIPTRESHTLFITILADIGLAGLLSGIWIAWRVLKRGLAAVRTVQDNYLRAVLISLVSVFVGFQVSLTFTNDYTNNFLFFFTGMIFAVIRLDRESSVSSPPGPEAQPV